MKLERNVKGLQESAQHKRNQAFEKVESGIKKLVKEQRPINFNTVAEASNVSKAWLYKQPEVRQRIEHLRSQAGSRQKTPPKHKASDESLKAIIETLKARVKRLEEENRDLRQQNQVAYGQVLRVKDLERQLARIEEENQNLRAQACPGELRPISKDNLASLGLLGVELNSTLERLISNTPEGIVSTALESLREALLSGQVSNPGGFLYKAITDAWKPNKTHQEGDMEEFNRWWKLAYSRRLVVASQQEGGILKVLTPGDEWVPFSTMLKRHPFDSLIQLEDHWPSAELA